MADITQNVEILLDRLYNLKGENNIIIREIIDKIDETERALTQADTDQTTNELGKVNCEEELEVFLTQKQTFEEVFQGFDNEAFSALREIDVNIEVGTLLTAIQERSPNYCEKLESKITAFQQKIDDILEERGRLTEDLMNLDVQRSKAEEERQQLASLLEQSLSPNEIERDSLTPHYVKKILSQFDMFSEEERSQLTKLLMFPDMGLYQYDQSYEERLSKGLINVTTTEEVEEPKYEEVVGEPVFVPEESTEEVVAEAVIEGKEEPTEYTVEEKTAIEVVEEVQEFYSHESEENAGLNSLDGDSEEPVEIVTEEQTFKQQFEQQFEEEKVEDVVAEPAFASVEENTEEPTEEVVVEEVVTEEYQTEPVEEPTVAEEGIEELLNRINLDKERFLRENTEEIEYIYGLLNSVEPRVIEENYETLRSLSLEEEVYKCRRGHLYIADAELNRKLTLLRAKGISETKIKDMIKYTNSGLRESFETVEERIIGIEKIHNEVNDDNINLMQCDVKLYNENVETLAKNGYELDEKEIRNHSMLLFESLSIPDNVEVLKDYLLSIVRNNGKYALSVFWKKPGELMRNIDDLIENDLESLITNNPSALAVSSDEIIKRIKYCEENGHPVYEGNGQNDFCDYIEQSTEFSKAFGPHVILPSLVDRREVNAKLAELIGNPDYTEILINTLDEHYANDAKYQAVELNEEMTDAFETLRHQLEEKAQAKLVGKYTYKISDVCISKNKFERNLMIILNALAMSNQSIEGVENEILLASALHNLRQNDENLQRVVGSCLGFNEENTLGGRKL